MSCRSRPSILIGLFLLQSRGTARVGACSGRSCCSGSPSWPCSASRRSCQSPASCGALDPRYAVDLFADHGWHAFVALGAVVLAVTGAEALYADMGHFGRRPIRLAWFGLVLPALVLNYFGQGALLLRDPDARRATRSILLVPDWALCAAGRAGDAGDRHRLAGGDLGRLLADPAGDPARLSAAHGDPPHLGSEIGQIYIPRVNWIADGRRRCRWWSASAPRATWPRPTASRSPAP